jgi:hypothetical protein
MKNIFAVWFVLIAVVPAHAGNCTTEPKSAWMTEEAIKSKIAEMGYAIKVFKVDGTCYEIYGENAKKQDVEVYFDPVTAKVVKEEIE